MFIVLLTTLFNFMGYIPSNYRRIRLLDWKGCGRMWSCPILRSHPSICLETQRNHYDLRQESLS